MEIYNNSETAFTAPTLKAYLATIITEESYKLPIQIVVDANEVDLEGYCLSMAFAYSDVSGSSDELTAMLYLDGVCFYPADLGDYNGPIDTSEPTTTNEADDAAQEYWGHPCVWDIVTKIF